MDSLRRRIPFKFSEPSETTPEEDQILDEQEQDELIHDLREQNRAMNERYMMVLRAILALSFCLNLIYLFSPTKESPLLALFPPTNSSPPIPLSTPLALLVLVVHLALALSLHPHRTYLVDIYLPSYTHLFAASALGPCLSLFLGRIWQTFLWWCIPVGVVFLVKTVQGWIDQGNMSILELEKLKYVSPGA